MTRGEGRRHPFLRPRPARLTELTARLAEIEASGRYTNFGPKNDELERRVVAELFAGIGRAVTCVNATTALLLTVRHERRPGRRFALLPSFTFAASAHAAIWNGLTPLLCDVDPETWLPDAASEEQLLAEHAGDVAVVVPQATFGNCLDLDRYEELARRFDVPVVVDAAAALGSQAVDGRQFGAGSPLPVVFSMHATKAFATDEGGLVYSARSDLVDDVRTMSNFGFGTPRQATMAGLNGKLSEIGALLALAKLDELDAVVGHRVALHAAYEERLPQLQFQRFVGVRQAHQFVPARLPGATRAQRDELVAELAGVGVELGTYFSPHLAEQPYFAELAEAAPLPHTTAVADEIVSLPLSDEMDRRDVDAIARALQSTWASWNVSPSSGGTGSGVTPAP
jgi:dTDP-4-amino-4,6-dideoxygalactose transaminase